MMYSDAQLTASWGKPEHLQIKLFLFFLCETVHDVEFDLSLKMARFEKTFFHVFI